MTVDAIAGPSSEPVSIGVGHIDPGHVVDDQGRRFVHLSGGHAVPMTATATTATASLCGKAPRGTTQIPAVIPLLGIKPTVDFVRPPVCEILGRIGMLGPNIVYTGEQNLCSWEA